MSDLTAEERLAEIARLYKAYDLAPLCRVCTGYSPIWDGHNYDCMGGIKDRIQKLLDPTYKTRHDLLMEKLAK